VEIGRGGSLSFDTEHNRERRKCLQKRGGDRRKRAIHPSAFPLGRLVVGEEREIRKSDWKSENPTRDSWEGGRTRGCGAGGASVDQMPSGRESTWWVEFDALKDVKKGSREFLS